MYCQTPSQTSVSTAFNSCPEPAHLDLVPERSSTSSPTVTPFLFSGSSLATKVRDKLSSLLTSNSPQLHSLSRSTFPSLSSSSATNQQHLQTPRGSRLPFAADDTDLYFRTKRRRATSNASLLSSPSSAFGAPGRKNSFDASANAQDAGRADGAGPARRRTASTGMTRSSSSGASSLLSRAPLGINEETDGGVNSPDSSSPLPVEHDSSPSDQYVLSSPEIPVSFIPATAASSTTRSRSTSRASLASVGSGSTIRAIPPRLNEESLLATTTSNGNDALSKIGRVSYTSEAQHSKSKARRAETLRRRLVDSFISLSLVSPSTSEDVLPTTRKRGGTGSSSLSRARLARSNSAGTTPFLRARSKTLSNPPSPPNPTSSPDRLAPFFVSNPRYKNSHPIFDIDVETFLVEDPEQWSGLAEGRVLVSVWTRSEDVKPFSSSSSDEKGQKREGELPQQKEEEEVEGWKLLVEWDVDFGGLVSLGRDSCDFPPLAPNSLVFMLHDEYFCAPLPSSQASDSDSSASDDGNVSDPGAIALVVARRNSKQVGAEELERRRKVLVDKTLRQTRMVRPAQDEAFLRSVRLEKELQQTRKEVKSWASKVELALDEPNGILSLQREVVERENVVRDLEQTKSSLSIALVESQLLTDALLPSLLPTHSNFTSSTLTIPPNFIPAPLQAPLPSLTDDILDNFDVPIIPPFHPASSSGQQPDKQAKNNDEEDGEEEVATRSPSTIKARSVRSISPVPDFKINGIGTNGTATAAHGTGAQVDEHSKEKVAAVKKGVMNGTVPGTRSVG
ncbi:hypothetical protein P7C70_g7094, partial [Phenoliferia sp. Uapishka_3]